eukprot:evm.model.scf_144.2 EVM.evm.TU.scf_144.2   scf_144:6580-9429(-)
MVDVATQNIALTLPAKGTAAEFDDGEHSPTAGDAIHIRVQQRNGRKSLTTVQGLDKLFEKLEGTSNPEKVNKFLSKVLKAIKKEFCCNGIVVEDEGVGKVIQLQGDQRKPVSQFLIQGKLAKKDMIKIHGF